ncbi:MAG: DUF2721 domain-containing protein [Prosthecobacter sp.]|uniref:DUF2721 domain-containing protein n=1 Tax=Prosthecobacter sp. TaxID=1965333 RepID=UPI0025F8A2A0|nr:DUF2721 domain-containing protein [Prosthecobacter sp.]MCF7787276.1 DUF2721 domain-containing protein [Prosthecobacter sp.]
MTLPDLPLSTPSLLFPAISLLMLAYTNRFLGLAAVVRGLHANWQTTQEPMLLAQIQSLRKRIQIIKHMQTAGVLSLMFCVASTTLLFFGRQTDGQITFGVSLILMLTSLALSLVEIQMSGAALDLQLRDVKCREK